MADIMKDAVDYYSKVSEEKSSILNDLNLQKNEFILATIHRQENTDNLENLKSIFEGLQEINKKKQVVLPLHPRTKSILEKNNSNSDAHYQKALCYWNLKQYEESKKCIEKAIKITEN